MKRALGRAAVIAALGLLPTSAHATTITTQTFCVATSDPVGESASCPAGLGATLSISYTSLAALALNQYDVTLTLDTTSALFNTATDPTIKQVQFDIAGYNGSDYQVQPPTLTTAPADGSWSVFFNELSANACSTDNLNAQHVCAASTLNGTATGDVDVWIFHIDLNDSLANITSSTDLNLRALFVGTDGCAIDPHSGKDHCDVAAILSPEFVNIPDTGSPGGGGDQPPVPEPTSLILLGSGLVFVGTRLRRRRH